LTRSNWTRSERRVRVIPDEEAQKIRTVQQAVDYINSHLKKA
jgi:hypothetical protein